MKREFISLLLLSFFLVGFASCEKDENVFENRSKYSPVPVDSLFNSKKTTVPIIAHRGCWSGDSLPQNSLAAFRKALMLNILGSEFDVRQTKDGQLVINHDATYNGLTISTSTYSDLCKYQLSNGETIPLLEDFVKAYKECETEVFMVVELKSCNVDDVLSMLEKYEVLSNVLFISFSKNYCNKLVKKGYGPITYYLNGTMTPEAVLKAGYAGIDYRHSVFQKHPEWITEAQVLGLQTLVWTVNDTDLIRDYLSNDVVVTSDRAQDYIKSISTGK